MDATQIILIVFIVLLIIIYPIMMFSKNKKENQRMLEQTNSLKRGDKVLTTSGVYGTIVDLQLQEDKKIVTIETGTEKKRGYLSIDAYAIYQIIRDEEVKEPVKETIPEVAIENEEKQAEQVETAKGTENIDVTENNVEDKPQEASIEEVKSEETVEEKPAPKKLGRKSRKKVQEVETEKIDTTNVSNEQPNEGEEN